MCRIKSKKGDTETYSLLLFKMVLTERQTTRFQNNGTLGELKTLKSFIVVE